jgi:hypothetical protein
MVKVDAIEHLLCWMKVYDWSVSDEEDRHEK